MAALVAALPRIIIDLLIFTLIHDLTLVVTWISRYVPKTYVMVTISGILCDGCGLVGFGWK